MTNTITVSKNSLFSASTHTVAISNADIATLDFNAREKLYNDIERAMDSLRLKNGITSKYFYIGSNWSNDDRKNYSLLSSNKTKLERYETNKALEESREQEKQAKEQAKHTKEVARLENKAKREQAKQAYENSHLYFNVVAYGDKTAKKQLGGFVLSNSIIITNYTNDGYIIVTCDKLGRPYISLNTRVKDNNGGNCRAKKELLALTRDTIKANVLESLKDRNWNDILKVVSNIKSFKTVCKNARINELVKAVEYNASRYDK